VIKHSFGKKIKIKKKPGARKTKRTTKAATKQPSLRLN